MREREREREEPAGRDATEEARIFETLRDDARYLGVTVSRPSRMARKVL